jgi:hypothetical protein
MNTLLDSRGDPDFVCLEGHYNLESSPLKRIQHYKYKLTGKTIM